MLLRVPTNVVFSKGKQANIKVIILSSYCAWCCPTSLVTLHWFYSSIIDTTHHYSPFQSDSATLSIQVIAFDTCLTLVWHLSRVIRHPTLLIVIIHCDVVLFLALWERFSYTLYSCHHVWHLFDTYPTSSVTLQYSYSPVIVIPYRFSPFKSVSATLSIQVIAFDTCLTPVLPHPSP